MIQCRYGLYLLEVPLHTTKTSLFLASIGLIGSIFLNPSTLADSEEPPTTTTFGPFYSKTSGETTSVSILPPLYSSLKEPAIEHTEWDVLYPLISSDRYGRESRLHFLQLLSFSGGSQNKDESKTTTLFPFYFNKDSPDEEQNYRALFPFYGTVKNRLLRDQVKVVMFPLYVQTKKRDVTTDNYLIPFFHLRHGNELHGWQAWPLGGWESKDITTKTNVVGATSLVGGHRKLSIAWPFYFHDRTDLGTPAPKKHHALLPIFSSFTSPQRDSFTAPWPIGLTMTRDDEKKFQEISLPWPFIVFARGEGKQVNRIWPLFGTAANPSLASQFYLWPLYRGQQLETDYTTIKQKRWAFFLYVDKIETKKKDQSSTRRRDFWPLFTLRTSSSGEAQLQALALIEPFLPANETIARHYSPLWALWRSTVSADSKQRSTSFLWNLYRREATKKEVKGSALFGLVRWNRSEQGRSFKLFGINLNRKQK
jgi:hypothetical protein